jgi:hypothetical protein
MRIHGVPDPKFSTITFNIPNPEVKESFDNLIPAAEIRWVSRYYTECGSRCGQNRANVKREKWVEIFYR